MSFLWDFFCCIRHGKQVKLEKLEGSSFAYKSCHSESGFFLFAFCFSPKNFFLNFTQKVDFACEFTFFPVLILGYKEECWRS